MSAPLGPSFPICWEQYHLADCEPVNAYVYVYMCGACSIIQASHTLGSVCAEPHACSPSHEHSRNKKSVHTYVLPSKQHACVVPSRREGLDWSRARSEKCSGQPFKEEPAPALVRALYTSFRTCVFQFLPSQAGSRAGCSWPPCPGSSSSNQTCWTARS